jgi:methyl-accepting chemotaxis protein
MNWSVGKKIGSGYALALIILIILGVLSYRNTSEFIEAAKLGSYTYEILINLEKGLSSIKDAETGQRGYILVGEDQYLKPFQAGASGVNQYMLNLRSLVSDNPAQKQRLDILESLITAKLAELDDTVNLRKNKGLEAALQMVRTDNGKKLMDDIRKIIADMGKAENMLLEQYDNKLKASSEATVTFIVYVIPFIFAELTLLGLWITHTITRQLREGVDQLSISSAEILAIIAQIASVAIETSSAVSETTATVEEVKQTAQVASQKARYVSESAQKATQISLNGRQSVENAVQGMHHIHEQVEYIAESMVRLSEQNQAIGEIIASVNGLAEQSNLLAVNAAIEAAKAGEQGKGFAVVAQEVKSLAKQSKQATAEVRTILGDIQKATSAAVLATEQGLKAVQTGMKQSTETGESIRLLADSIMEAVQAATQIAASSQQQMVGMDQVARAMENIKQASVENMSGTRQAEIAAQNLHGLGLNLGFLIGGKAA